MTSSKSTSTSKATGTLLSRVVKLPKTSLAAVLSIPLGTDEDISDLNIRLDGWLDAGMREWTGPMGPEHKKYEKSSAYEDGHAGKESSSSAKASNFEESNQRWVTEYLTQATSSPRASLKISLVSREDAKRALESSRSTQSSYQNWKCKTPNASKDDDDSRRPATQEDFEKLWLEGEEGLAGTKVKDLTARPRIELWTPDVAKAKTTGTDSTGGNTDEPSDLADPADPME